MFAALLRRWRIVTPVVTALVALSIVVSAFIAPASAHTLKFRFSGDAADFINYSTSPAYFDCFSGWLSKVGAEVNSGLTACVSPGFDVSPGGPLSVSVFADVARWDLAGTNSSTSGRSVSNSEVFGELDGTGDGVVVRLDNTFKCEFRADLIKAGYCTYKEAKDGTVVQEFSDPVVSSLDVNETATAKCVKQGNHGEASAWASVSFDHLKVIDGGVDYESESGDTGTANFDTIANAAGSINQSVQIVRSFQLVSPETINGKTQIVTTDFELIVTTNDFHTWVDGNTSAVSGNGLHVILQAEDGQIAADVVLAHAHADIECAFSPHSFTDPFGL